MSEKYNRSITQLILRWHVQNGLIPVIRSWNPEHLKSDYDIFDFEISEEDMWMLTCMPQETWQGEHPDFAVPKKKSNFGQ